MDRTAHAPRRLDRLPAVATVLALLACYGTLLLIGLLSALGITLVLHEGAWAGAISLFAVLAFAGTLFGYRRHLHFGPPLAAFAGALLIVWVMFGSYSLVVEIAGFILLIAAAWWDWNLKSSTQTKE